MAKRRVKRQQRSRVPRNMSMTTTVRIPFRDVTTVLRTASAGYEISTINLNIPSFASGSRIRTMASLYEYFRISKLKVKAFRDFTSVNVYASGQYALGAAHGIGFIPSASNDFIAPTSFDSLMQLPSAKMGPNSQVLNLSVQRQGLTGSTPVKWYHTSTTGSPPLADSSAGSVIYITRQFATADQLSSSYIELQGVVEFKSPVSGGDAVGLEAFTTLGEEKKVLRIVTGDEDFNCDQHPRTSVREEFYQVGSSVPNTPRALSDVLLTRSNTSIGTRSDRQIDRPRLVR